MTASQPTYVTISGELKQTQGGKPLDGFFWAYVPCNAGTTPWTVDVQSYLYLFHGRTAALYRGGKAIVIGSATAYDPDTGEFIERNLSAKVTLRGKK